MFVVGIPHRPIVHGKCSPCSLVSLNNYLTELSWKDVIGLVSSANFFRCGLSPHIRLSDVVWTRGCRIL